MPRNFGNAALKYNLVFDAQIFRLLLSYPLQDGKEFNYFDPQLIFQRASLQFSTISDIPLILLLRRRKVAEMFMAVVKCILGRSILSHHETLALLRTMNRSCGS